MFFSSSYEILHPKYVKTFICSNIVLCITIVLPNCHALLSHSHGFIYENAKLRRFSCITIIIRHA